MSAGLPYEPGEDRFYFISISDGEPRADSYGASTIGIVDEESGGIVAYCHELNGDRIVAALRAAAATAGVQS